MPVICFKRANFTDRVPKVINQRRNETNHTKLAKNQTPLCYIFEYRPLWNDLYTRKQLEGRFGSSSFQNRIECANPMEICNMKIWNGDFNSSASFDDNYTMKGNTVCVT